MFPGSTSGISCPGCQPGDFAQPHICGIGRIVTGHCYLCDQPWSGSHICIKAWAGADTSTVAPTITTSTGAIVLTCDHCWCLKQPAGWYDVPSLKPAYPGFLQNTERRHLKPHMICCNCGQRRVKEG